MRNQKKNLTLSRESVRVLASADLQRVVGGAPGERDSGKATCGNKTCAPPPPS